MVITHVFPVFFLLLLGVALKKIGITDDAFLKTTDRMIYYIFFPLMLFWKIGAADQQFTDQAVRFYIAVICAVLVVYLLSILVILSGRVTAFQAGAFSQSCYRFNTYVGMAVILSVLGEEGVALFGVMIGMAIPIINILAVSTLIWFSGLPVAGSNRTTMLGRSIISNPLILGCAAGLLYAHWVNAFPLFVDNTFRLAAAVTLPLALLSIGGGLTLKSLTRYFGVAGTASVVKLLILPLVGYWIMNQMKVGGIHFKVGMIFFALPTSTAIYVLSSQLNSDTELASAAIVLSTALSMVSLSVVLEWLYA